MGGHVAEWVEAVQAEISGKYPYGLGQPPAELSSGVAMIQATDVDAGKIRPDNLLRVDPAAFAHGAIFWPDYGRLQPERSIWQLTGVTYRDEPEFETGQIVMDKQRCCRPLALTMWMNEHSDFWYQHIHGDKETFHIAWRKLGLEYAMIPHPIVSLPYTMCQHDFAGGRIFQHRNSAKWSLDGHNPIVPGFIDEAACVAHLSDLRRLWPTRLTRPFEYDLAEEPIRDLASRLRQPNAGPRPVYA